MDQTSIPATVLSVAVPILVDIQRVEISPADKYVFATLLQSSEHESLEDWYASLPSRVTELTELEFRDVIGRLRDAGLAEQDDGSISVRRPNPRHLVRLALPSVPPPDGP